MASLVRRAIPAVGWSSSNGLWGRTSAGTVRSLSDNAVYVNVEKRDDKIAVVKMAHKPVNALNYEHLTQLKTTFEELEDDRGVKSIVVASDVPRIYSAGLDIMEMYQATDESARRFWTSLQDMWLSLYNNGKPTIAAINGASPAGGCLIACACDYRVMADVPKFTIGLNETKLGISAPFWFIDSFINVVGQRTAERALKLGTLFPPTEALRIGLVDEVVASDHVMEHAMLEAQEHMKINNVARMLTKRNVRSQTVDRFESERQNDVDMFVAFIMQDAVQASLGKYLEALKAKSK